MTPLHSSLIGLASISHAFPLSEHHPICPSGTPRPSSAHRRSLSIPTPPYKPEMQHHRLKCDTLALFVMYLGGGGQPIWNLSSAFFRISVCRIYICMLTGPSLPSSNGIVSSETMVEGSTVCSGNLQISQM